MNNGGADVKGMSSQLDPLVGAIQSVAANPTNPNQVFAGTASGGIWLTNNATSLFPTWTPQTDSQPTLSIGDIAFSPLDANTLFAGTGNFTNGGFGSFTAENGGDAFGVLKTTNMGATWTLYGQSVFGPHNQAIRTIVPSRLLSSSGGQVVLAGTVSTDQSIQGGFFLSGDGGQTWRQLNGDPSQHLLPNGNIYSIVEDPVDPNVFYAALPGSGSSTAGSNAGIYRSDDGGLTWNLANGTDPKMTIPQSDFASADNVQLSIRLYPKAGPKGQDITALYALLGGTPIPHKPGTASLWRSIDSAANWTQMPTPPAELNPDGQTAHNLTIVADIASDMKVFIAGSATGDLLYFDPATQSWLDATGEGAKGNGEPSKPHSDARDLQFDAAGNIIETDDGGIYRLVNPDADANTRYWVSVNGNIRPSEFYSIGYDTNNQFLVGGAQDNGFAIQTAPNNISWTNAVWADTTHVAVDDSNPQQTTVFGGKPKFTYLYRITYGGAANPPTLPSAVIFLGLSSTPLANPFAVPTADIATQNIYNLPTSLQYLSGLDPLDKATVTEGADNYIPFVLNTVNPQRMLIGLNALYESFNQGDLINEIITPAAFGSGAQVSALAYGGYSNGQPAPDVALAGTSKGQLYLRTTANGSFGLVGNFATAVVDIKFDPTNWNTVYVVTASLNQSPGHIYMTTNIQGAAWVDVTGDLGNFVSKLRTVEIIKPGSFPGNTVLVAGGLGGLKHVGGAFFTTNPGSGSTWAAAPPGLPNAQVFDLHYVPSRDMLVAGLFGRGGWTLANASFALTTDPLALYVNSLYDHVLNRAPDVLGEQNWVAELRGGVSRLEVAQGFWRSSEHRGIQVDQFYQTFFHQAGDAAGRAFWINSLVAGASEEQVAAQFLTSLQYSLSHPTIQEYIKGLYADVLGVSMPDAAGESYWIDQMTNHRLSRLGAADLFLSSTQKYGQILVGYYADFLGRAPDSIGYRGWLAWLLTRKLSRGQAAEGFLASDEFFTDALMV
jgi:hypothetical protein